MQMEPATAVVVVWCGVMGLFVGSFLNVAIHRHPLEGESVGHPRRSRCPNCRTTLSWKENLPLVSWLVQRGRCRHCGWGIPLRYPLVELITAGLWVVVALATPGPQYGLLAVRLVVVSGLIVATFVDFDCYEIPDEVSIGGMVLAPVASFLVPALHQDSALARRLSQASEGAPVDRFGALMTCLVGMAVGGGILWGIGWVGKKVLKKEAMGFGDVKLLAAAGGFVGAGGAMLALILASCVGSVLGIANILRVFVAVRRHLGRVGRRHPFCLSWRLAHSRGSVLPFGPCLALGIGISLLYWNDVLL
jgi:leader peptidase (prepilin peptidase)/N-methyltransferase